MDKTFKVQCKSKLVGEGTNWAFSPLVPKATNSFFSPTNDMQKKKVGLK